MSICNYVRLVEGRYEFGRMVVQEAGTKKEKREYIKQGVRPTLDEALDANAMTPMLPPRTRPATPVSVEEEVAKVIHKAKSLRETECVGAEQ